MLSAGLIEDPRTLLTSMNELLTLALEKHWNNWSGCQSYWKNHR